MNYQIEKSDSKYHIDLFGTLVRYFPLFNFNNNDAKSVIVVDIDINPSISTTSLFARPWSWVVNTVTIFFEIFPDKLS